MLLHLAIPTDFLSNELYTTEQAISDGSESPMGRGTQVVQIAPVYVALADAQNSYASGGVYSADCGTGAF